MSMHAHVLAGCSPTPLACYLKALGVLRVIAEQKDPEARGAWRDEAFVLITSLSWEELMSLLLVDYSPTPIFSPWGKDSGLYKDTKKVVAALRQSTSRRFERFRQAIDQAFAIMQPMIDAYRTEKDKSSRQPKERGRSTFAELKESSLRQLRHAWRNGADRWMSAALAMSGDGSANYASLLGSGGNDGRLDFGYNAIGRINDLFDLGDDAARSRPAAREWLEQSLLGTCAPHMPKAKIGMMHPHGTGGPNSTTGPEGESFSNPWDFLLMLEGAINFQAGTSRVLDSTSFERVSFPFSVRSHATGDGVMTQHEEASGEEQWIPIWNRPISLPELQNLLIEGRAQLGASVARSPLDFARSVSRLGVARGITCFARYGYLQRNGQSCLAIPLGRIEVTARPVVRLLDDIDHWLDQNRRWARDKNAPARYRDAEHRLADAAFTAATRHESPMAWQELLLAMTDIEKVQATGTGTKAGPIPRLRPDWIHVVDDGSPEVRLACALASAEAECARKNAPNLGSLRHHFLPLRRSDRGNARFATDGNGRLRHDTRVVANGRDAIVDLIAVAARRLLESEDSGRLFQLQTHPSFAARVTDLACVFAGGVDLERVLGLARALMAVQWPAAIQAGVAPRNPDSTSPTSLPPAGWSAIRLTMLPWPLPNGPSIGTDPAIVRRLAAGDAAQAFTLARRRLLSRGIIVGLPVTAVSAAEARLWAASLLFPISPRAAQRLARSLDPLSLQVLSDGR